MGFDHSISFKAERRRASDMAGHRRMVRLLPWSGPQPFQKEGCPSVRGFYMWSRLYEMRFWKPICENGRWEFEPTWAWPCGFLTGCGFRHRDLARGSARRTIEMRFSAV